MLKEDYIINSIFNSITYILRAGTPQDVWLVDCGDIEPILERIGERRVTAVLLTHAHFDHIYGLPELLKVFPDAVIYTNEFGKEALGNDRLNMSKYQDQSIVVKDADIRVVADGDTIGPFTVYETPGHNPSCLCFASEDAIFTGDAYIPGIQVVTNLPKCNKEQAQESLERILKLAEGKTIYPGHSVELPEKALSL